MTRTTTDTSKATDEALTTAALKGDDDAFAELHRRHAPVAWRLALAITGDPDLAARAVVDGTGTLSASRRAGRSPARPHAVALAAATRNAALDLRRSGSATSPAVADEADALLAGAFAALPERWRSILWLRDAERHDAAQVAPVVELAPEAVDQLAVRARRGLRERYLRAQAGAAGPRSCTRAIARLGALDDGTLNAKDRETLERHLRRCPACSERRDRVAGLAAALPALALPVPGDLTGRSHEAWTAALAAPTRTGLSPRAEKVLAGASALAAALGIVGAAVFGSGGDGEPTASPLAPLVADIETPRPVDLSEVTLPLVAPTPVAGADAVERRLLSTALRRTPAATFTGTSSEVAAPALPTGSGVPGAPTAPAAEGPTSPSQPPVAITPEDGVVLGPIQVDTSPDGGPTVVVGLPGPLAPLAPVVDPLLGIVNGVVTPVVDPLQPITQPILGLTQTLTQPLTGAITSVSGGVG
jgi:DNA-directed RNA polymerase specialized sigma24 family protein